MIMTIMLARTAGARQFIHSLPGLFIDPSCYQQGSNLDSKSAVYNLQINRLRESISRFVEPIGPSSTASMTAPWRLRQIFGRVITFFGGGAELPQTQILPLL